MKPQGFISHHTPGTSHCLPSSPRISPSIKKNPQVHIIMTYRNNECLLEFLKINQVGTTSPLNKLKLILLDKASAKSIALNNLWYLITINFTIFKFNFSKLFINHFKLKEISYNKCHKSTRFLRQKARERMLVCLLSRAPYHLIKNRQLELMLRFYAWFSSNVNHLCKLMFNLISSDFHLRCPTNRLLPLLQLTSNRLN